MQNNEEDENRLNLIAEFKNTNKISDFIVDIIMIMANFAINTYSIWLSKSLFYVLATTLIIGLDSYIHFFLNNFMYLKMWKLKNKITSRLAKCILILGYISLCLLIVMVVWLIISQPSPKAMGMGMKIASLVIVLLTVNVGILNKVINLYLD